jgi:hypothetical protein
MSRHFQKDYIYGKQQENIILPLIEQYFDDNITQTPNQYDKYDSTSNFYNFELKSRKNKFNTYPTTMITKNKLIKTDKQLILLFNFLDGLYYIKYDPIIFDTFESKLFKRPEVCTFPLEHVLIPIGDLKLIKKYN